MLLMSLLIKILQHFFYYPNMIKKMQLIAYIHNKKLHLFVCVYTCIQNIPYLSKWGKIPNKGFFIALQIQWIFQGFVYKCKELMKFINQKRKKKSYQLISKMQTWLNPCFSMASTIFSRSKPPREVASAVPPRLCHESTIFGSNRIGSDE